MNLNLKRLSLIVLATALFASGCGPGQLTPDLNVIAQQVSTSVAATISAMQSATAGASSPTPTLVPSLTPTFTPVVPTASPFVITPPTTTGGGGGSGGGGGGSPQLTYSCDPDIGKRPRDNSEYGPGDDFDVKWTILNTGTATWPAGTDLTCHSGCGMTSYGGTELPEMKPGDKFSVVFEGNAPAQSGFQVLTFKVQGGFCYPYVAIRVK